MQSATPFLSACSRQRRHTSNAMTHPSDLRTFASPHMPHCESASGAVPLDKGAAQSCIAEHACRAWYEQQRTKATTSTAYHGFQLGLVNARRRCRGNPIFAPKIVTDTMAAARAPAAAPSVFKVYLKRGALFPNNDKVAQVQLSAEVKCCLHS